MGLVFLDLEASSLLPGSFPIEVAWVLGDGTGEGHLIRPADGWLADAQALWRTHVAIREEVARHLREGGR